MPDRSKQKPSEDESSVFSAPMTIPSTGLKASRWQLLAASAMLAIWIAFLAVMALYS